MTISKAKPRAAKVYIISTPTGVRLIKATSVQGAIKYAVLGTHDGRVATQEDLIAHMGKVRIEDATAAEGDDA